MTIQEICNKYYITNYTINQDGSIDVDGGVNLNGEYLTELPLTFNSVTGNFYCTNNELTTLKGCPKYVGGSFICTYNKLTDNYCDSNIGGYFFTTLKQDGLNISNSCRFNNYKEFQLIQKRKRILGKILI